METLKILVLSDLHVHSKAPFERDAPSQFSLQPRYQTSTHNPILACEDLLKSQSGAIDWIVCPGDLGDKNDSVGKHYAWRELNRLKRRIGAGQLIAAVGNHDIDSRRVDGTVVPDADLRALSPKFPTVGTGSKGLNADFWQKGFIIKKFAQSDVTLCVLNSCAFHGVISSDEEHRRGRLSDDVIEQIQGKLRSMCSSVNVLLMHHHAHRHPWLHEDESHAVNGLRLIEVLKESGSRWLVIHGHRHLPQLWYSGADRNSSVILSAGSPSATPYMVRGRTTRNQMHLVTLDKRRSAATPEELYGTVHSWSWSQGVGWVAGNTGGDGLPAICGFGRMGGVDLLASELHSLLTAASAPMIDWRMLSASQPQINNLTPADFSALQDELQRRSIEILFDRYGIPSSIQQLRAV
jgi:predicted phosphodiesterase